jgi:hypothetical protein
MTQGTTTKFIGLLLDMALESRRQSNLRAEVITKRIDNLEKMVGLVANACVESGFQNAETFQAVKGFTESNLDEDFRVMFSQEIAALDHLEGLIEEFKRLAGLPADPEEPG